jgi:hypothetical protein
MAGYGMWWVIVEMLREQTNHMLPEKKYTWASIARETMSTPEQVQEFVSDCINEFELLFSSDSYFYSESLCKRMEKLETIRLKRKKAAEKKWSMEEIDKKDANAMQVHNKCNANAMHVHDKCITNAMQNDAKESKVKESKVKESNTISPAYADVADDSPPPPVKKKPMSAMKDPLADYYQNRFIERTPAEAWKSIPQERTQLNKLAKNTRQMVSVTGFEDEIELAESILSMYERMKQTSRERFIRDGPWTPSGLVARWDQVIESMRQTVSVDNWEEMPF